MADAAAHSPSEEEAVMGSGLWQGFQRLTDYKPLPRRFLPDKLNNFYAWFEVNNTTRAYMLPLPPGHLRGERPASTHTRRQDQIRLMSFKDTSAHQAAVPRLKSAIITPVSKKANPVRPVALTPVVS